MNKCPSCGSEQYAVLPFGGYRYLGLDLPLVRCGQCALKYVRHDLTPKQIQAFYDEPEYFDSEYAGGVARDYESNKPEMMAKAEYALGHIMAYKRAGSLLDVGSAGGYFIEAAKEKGFGARGVEVSHEMVEFGRAHGLSIHEGTVFTLPPEWNNIDVAYMGDVLEHIAEPHAFLKKLHEIMRPGGILAIEVPLTYQLTLSGLPIGLYNMLRGRFGYMYFLPAQHRGAFVPKPPYHLLMFNRKSITKLLASEGFKVRRAKIYEGKPKEKFGLSRYGFLKMIGHYITRAIPHSPFGDRMFVIAEKQ